MIRCVEVSLSIPDNEARTALTTLQRLGIHAGGLERADLYRCDVEDARAGDVVETLRGLETIFNPNKHLMRLRPDCGPGPGEVWIDELRPAAAALTPVRIAGRVLPGVRSLERMTAWRIADASGAPAEADVVAAAAETLLCNSAFQIAIRA